jgi:hypothetical protein
MFKRHKKTRSADVPIVHPPEVLGRTPEPGSADELRQIIDGRAPHNPHQQLIPAGQQQTATELVAAAGTNLPMLAGALGQIAQRFEQSVQATHALNVGLAQFRETVVNGLMGELKQLRYNLGDKLTHTTTNLDAMVNQLDKVLWSALRAQGMSDDAIRQYRTEHGMEPEAPSGPELIAHLAELEGLRAANAALVAQNQRLLVQLEGVHQIRQEEAGWVWHQECQCMQCQREGDAIAAAQEEARNRDQQGRLADPG